MTCNVFGGMLNLAQSISPVVYEVVWYIILVLSVSLSICVYLCLSDDNC